MGKPTSKALLGVEERELNLELQDHDYRWGAAAHESYTQGFPGGEGGSGGKGSDPNDQGDGLQVTDMEAGGGVNGRSFLGGQLDAPKRADCEPSEEERGLTRFRGIW